MATKYLEVFAALAAPMQDVKTRQGPGGRPLRYITARQVMNRLDEVLGPENWWDDFRPFGEHGGQICLLTIRLPDGSLLTKPDAGGSQGMQDEGDDDKSAYSSALKRSAVKFGIGRELYCDGVAKLRGGPDGAGTPPQDRPIPVGSNPPRSGHIRPLRSLVQPRSARELFGIAQKWSADYGLDFVETFRHWARVNGVDLDREEWDIRDVLDCHLHMACELDAAGLLDLPPEARDAVDKVYPRPASGTPPPGPLTICKRDPQSSKKEEIVDIARRLYEKAFQATPSEAVLMAYIQTRCKDHKIVLPPTIRNLGVPTQVSAILLALKSDEEESRKFSEGGPGHAS